MIPITNEFIVNLSEQSKSSDRKRKNYNYHKKSSDTLQRLLNAMEPGTYVQPHKHENPDKRETFIILRGEILVVEFDDKGNIKDPIILDHSKGNFSVGIPQRTWYTIISLKSGSVVYELKDEPYDPNNDKIFADWVPSENSKETQNSVLLCLMIKNKFMKNQKWKMICLMNLKLKK